MHQALYEDARRLIGRRDECSDLGWLIAALRTGESGVLVGYGSAGQAVAAEVAG